jgi:hypothetical protein
MFQHFWGNSKALHEGVSVTVTAELATVNCDSREYFQLKFTKLVPMTINKR